MPSFDSDGIPTKNLMFCKCGKFIGPVEETGPGWYECVDCVQQDLVDAMEADDILQHQIETGER